MTATTRFTSASLGGDGSTWLQGIGHLWLRQKPDSLVSPFLHLPRPEFQFGDFVCLGHGRIWCRKDPREIALGEIEVSPAGLLHFIPPLQVLEYSMGAMFYYPPPPPEVLMWWGRVYEHSGQRSEMSFFFDYMWKM